MPVTVRGAYSGKVSPAGWTTIAWPAGTAEGDLAWVHCGGSLSPLGPDSFGWIPVGHKAWWKILSASDLSASLTVSARRTSSWSRSRVPARSGARRHSRA